MFGKPPKHTNGLGILQQQLPVAAACDLRFKVVTRLASICVSDARAQLADSVSVQSVRFVGSRVARLVHATM